MNNTIETFKELFFGIAMLLFSIIGITYLLPNYIIIPRNLDSIYLSPAFWPNIILWILGFLGIIMSVTNLNIIRKEQMKFKDIFTDRSKKMAINCVFCFLIFTLSLLNIELLGLPLVTILAMFALYYLAERKVTIGVILTILIVPWVLYAFFTYAVDIMIPLGFMDWR